MTHSSFHKTTLLASTGAAVVAAFLPTLAFAGDILGVVQSAATGKALAGAEVRAGGQVGRTQDDGSFSLPALTAGTYHLIAHLPGYSDAETDVQVPDMGPVSVALQAQPITGGSTVGEVTVTGKYIQRDAPVLQLDALNTTAVLTAKDLTHTPDENIASSLSRLPGVTALPGGFSESNGVAADFPGRGEANYVSLRGLDAEFNINTVNGVDVAQGEPYSREVQLALLPPTGLQTVVVNKTLTPVQDGDAIGGAIDYRTPTAYDFTGRQAFTFEAGARANDRAIDYGQTPLAGEIALSAARKFGGADQLGVYASAYYDVRTYDNSIVDGIYPAQVNGMFAYSQQTASGASAPAADLSKNLTLTGIDLGLTSGVEERFGGSLSIDWRPSANFSGYSRFTYAHQSVTQDTYYSQIYGNNIGASQIGATGVYQPLIANVKPRFYYETDPEEALLSTYQLGADMRFDRLHVSPNLFASWGYNDEPDHFEFSARQPELAAGYAYGGSSLFGYGENPSIKLPASEIANLSNIAGYGARRAGEVTDEFASQVKLGAKVDATYDLNLGWLQSLQFGAKFQSSNRDHNVRDFTTNKLFTTDANDPSFGSLGVFNGSVSAIVPGVYNIPIPLISNQKAFALFKSHIASDFGGSLAATSDECGSIYQNTVNCDTQHGIEQVSAVYLLANIQAGPVQIIPGLRFEHADIRNTYYVLPQDAAGDEVLGSFQHNSTSYNEPLPSVAVNYRPDPMQVYRAQIWRSYVRPSPFQLGGSSQIMTSGGGAGAGGTTTVTQGNPNLKTIEATNYDVSGEWLIHQGGSASAAFFYKELNHFIFDTINAFTNQTSLGQGSTVISEPLNGGSGHVYGVELAGRQRFVFLAAPFDEFGLGGNVTWEQSGVHTNLAGLNPTERLQNQPDWSANAQIFYEAHNIDAQLSYRYVDAYVSQYGTLSANSQLDTWVRENRRLDLHLGYLTPWRVHVDFAVANLADNKSYYATIGRHSDAIATTIDSGRTYSLTARYAF